jgi:lysophospholipase L1-like esterase
VTTDRVMTAPVAAAGSRRRGRQWLGALCLAVTGLIVAVAALEVGVRVIAPQDLRFFDWTSVKRPSQKTGRAYEYIPGGQNPRYLGVPVSINRLGLRDDEVTIPKPAGTVRLVAVGDSVTFGYGVRLEDTWVKALERRLNAAGRGRYEVINAGVEETGIEYYESFIRTEAPALEPDLVLVGLVLNDVRSYGGEQRPVDQGVTASALRLARGVNATLVLNSHLYLASYLSLKSVLYGLGLIDVNRAHAYDFAALTEPSPVQDRAWESTEKHLRTTIDAARGRGWPIAFVVFPVEPQLGSAAAELYRRRLGMVISRGAEAGEPQHRLARFFAAQDVPMVDLMAAYRNRGDVFLRNAAISHDPVHPSPVGHAIAGDAIHRFLEDERVLPKGAR